jgi:hypothetical protein
LTEFSPLFLCLPPRKSFEQEDQEIRSVFQAPPDLLDLVLIRLAVALVPAKPDPRESWQLRSD